MLTGIVTLTGTSNQTKDVKDKIENGVLSVTFPKVSSEQQPHCCIAIETARVSE